MELSSWPFYTKEEIERVKNVLISGKVNYWTGNETKCFEREFAKYIDVNFSVAFANGTLALSAAYLALGIKKGDEIITTPRTFIATSSTILLLGAKPVFADVDINSGNITADKIKPLINKSTKAISVVHLGGWPAEMESICALAKEYGLLILEDCSQAHGASIKEKKVGSFGDISTWSFCQDKIISTGGEGGMVTTNSEELYKKVWSLKDHGKSLDLVRENNQENSSFKWLHENLGSNCRLTEMQSAIGRIQLRNLSKTNYLRSRNANLLINELKDIPILRIPTPPNHLNHAWYKFYAYLEKKKLKNNWDKIKIIKTLNKNGAKAFSGSCSEIYLEKCIKKNNASPKERLPNAKILGENSLMFLVHHTICEEQMTKYAQLIKNVLLEASL